MSRHPIDKTKRANLKNQKPMCIWFTGLPCSGKTTLAIELEKQLYDKKIHTYLMDGDQFRTGLSRDLSFTAADRAENIRRAAEVARLMVDAGLVVIAAFISPTQAERLTARQMFAEGEFIEVFTDAPLAECEARDLKGLYAKARNGELKNFTAIDAPYEKPEAPELRLDTHIYSAEQCLEKILAQQNIANLCARR